MKYIFHFYVTLKKYVQIQFKKSKKGIFIVTIYFSLSDSGITQAPAIPVQQTNSFNLKYKAVVDCNNFESIRNQIEANILVK